MTDYRIHKDTYFCTTQNTLKLQIGTEVQEIALDNLESKLLEYFIANPGKVISKDELMGIWSSQYVMEHSLTRVISTLRKKLGSINDLSALIKTVPREGYQYNGLAVAEQNQSHQPVAVEKPLKDKKPGKNTYILTGILLITVVFYLLYDHNSNQQQYSQAQTLPSVHEIVDSLTLKEGVALNMDGETLVYAAKEKQGKWFLKAASLKDQFSWQHAIENYNLLSPTWLNEREIIYVMHNSEHCSIRKINLYKAPGNNIGIPIGSCDVRNPSRGLSTLDKNTILLSDSQAANLPMQLVTIDVGSGKKRVHHNDSYSGLGVYRLFTSPNKQYVATLSSKNWFDTDINVFEAEQLTQPIWSKTVDYPLFSIAFDNEKLVFKDEKGRFRIASYTDTSNKNGKTVPLVITRPVYSPTYAPNGFFFTEGGMITQNISLTSMDSTDKQMLTDMGSVSIKKPVMLSDNKLMIYASNQTGINQIWSKNLTTGKYEQLSRFEHSYFIESIAVDEVSGLIAIETNNEIILGKFDITGKVIVEHHLDGKMPSFWQGKLLFSVIKDNQSIVYQFDPIQQSTDILIENGAFKTLSEQGQLFYSKYHTSGIWRYNEQGQDSLIYDEKSSYVGEDWDIYQQYLYIRNTDGNVDQVKIDEPKAKLVKSYNNSCLSLNIVSKDTCLSVDREPSINRLLKFNFN